MAGWANSAFPSIIDTNHRNNLRKQKNLRDGRYIHIPLFRRHDALHQSHVCLTRMNSDQKRLVFQLCKSSLALSYVVNGASILFAWNRTSLKTALLYYFGFAVGGGVLGCLIGIVVAYYFCQNEPVRTIPPIMVILPMFRKMFTIQGINYGCALGLLLV